MKAVSIGIDLGTTNCTAAWMPTAEDLPPEDCRLRVVDIPQLEKPGAIADYHQLPSALYLPFEGEHSPELLAMPWNGPVDRIIGRYAKERSSAAPDRVVLSAKSWLCNPQIDRKAAILPWGSEIQEPKVSPFEASREYLQHLKHAAARSLQQFAAGGASLEQAEITVTVPASFDEAARNLTAEAAAEAGLSRVVLLEEPLAALYSWIARQGERWREHIEVGDIILVCDLGGGTADFSLVLVGEENGELALERLSVGDHILLGGDNMDLALAYQLRAKLESQGKKLDTWQFHALVHEARKVKERMLSSDDNALPVTLAGRGSSLFSSTVQVEARRDEVLTLILDGFFPQSPIAELPEQQSAAGIQEFGLHFEAEPAITKHLSAFLHQSFGQVAKMSTVPEEIRERAGRSDLMPTAVLFNGGVCRSALIRGRIMNVLGSWSSEAGRPGAARELEGNDYDTGVAEGAAHYGHIRVTGRGLRIRAGIPRSYYLGLQTSMPAVPGFRPPVKGVCVVPQGMEEGSEASLSEKTFSLVTGKEVEFRFFSSHRRPDDAVGAMLDDAESELEETSRLSISLPRGPEQQVETVPVQIQSRVTDVGTLELWMREVDGSQRWKLEFDVRGEKKTPQIGMNRA